MINNGNASSRKRSCDNAHSVTGVHRSQLKYLISHCYRLEFLLFKNNNNDEKKNNNIIEFLCIVKNYVWNVSL